MRNRASDKAADILFCSLMSVGTTPPGDRSFVFEQGPSQSQLLLAYEQWLATGFFFFFVFLIDYIPYIYRQQLVVNR